MKKDADWHQIRFLESATNLKRALSQAVGRTPSTTIARAAAACLQQGRFYYEAAGRAPLEIRPLLLYYGFVAFARALVVGRTGQGLSTLSRSHGLSDTTLDASGITELRVKILASGTFQAFNDQVRLLSRLVYISAEWEHDEIWVPAASSADLAGSEIDLQTLLARVPFLEKLYQATFDDRSLTQQCRVISDRNDATWMTLILEAEPMLRDVRHVVELIKGWRVNFPCLRAWRVVQAETGAGKTFVRFANVSPMNIDEEADLLRGWPDLDISSDVKATARRTPVSSIVAAPAGGIATVQTYLVAPIGDHYLSEFSVQFLILFALASLVRYRPDAWAHAISRSSLPNRPADDSALALIERFLELHVDSIVPLMVAGLNPDQFEH